MHGINMNQINQLLQLLTIELPLTLASRRGRLDGGCSATSDFNSDIYETNLGHIKSSQGTLEKMKSYQQHEIPPKRFNLNKRPKSSGLLPLQHMYRRCLASVTQEPRCSNQKTNAVFQIKCSFQRIQLQFQGVLLVQFPSITHSIYYSFWSKYFADKYILETINSTDSS